MKWKHLFRQGLVKHENSDYSWNFNVKAIQRELSKSNNFASWSSGHGMIQPNY